MPEVDARVAVAGNLDPLWAALVNLLQNAFKRTHPRTDLRCKRMPRWTAFISTLRTTVAASQPDSPKRCSSPSRKVASKPRDIELQQRVESAGSLSGQAKVN